MTKPIQLSTTIPFSGFYESLHSDNIESAINSYFDKERDGDNHPPDEFYFSFKRYHDIQNDYVKLYVESFADWFEGETGIALPLTFEEMTSPKEYNFTTDRIFCQLPLKTIRAIRKYVPDDVLKKTIEANHTSRSGFISFYSNDFETWQSKPLSKWDHNELGTLLDAALVFGSDAYGENSWEYYLLESASCNGCFDDIVYPYCAKWEDENPVDANADAIKTAFDIPNGTWEEYSDDEKEAWLERYNARVVPCELTLDMFKGV